MSRKYVVFELSGVFIPLFCRKSVSPRGMCMGSCVLPSSSSSVLMPGCVSSPLTSSHKLTKASNLFRLASLPLVRVGSFDVLFLCRWRLFFFLQGNRPLLEFLLAICPHRGCHQALATGLCSLLSVFCIFWGLVFRVSVRSIAIGLRAAASVTRCANLSLWAAHVSHSEVTDQV